MEPNSLGEEMAYQILAFIIFGLIVICAGLFEDKESINRATLVSGGIGWIICSLLFPAINHIINKPFIGGG